MSHKRTVQRQPPLRGSELPDVIQQWLLAQQTLLPLLVFDTTASPETFALPNAGLDNSQTGQTNQNQELICIKGSSDANTVTITGAISGTVVLAARYDLARFKSDATSWWLAGIGSSTVPVPPHSFPKVASEWLDSYNSGTGLFTASQPSAADLSNGVLGAGAVVLASALAIVTPNFADEETPVGTINSVNLVFTLAHSPSPGTCLQLFYNGLLQKPAGSDFTLSLGNIVTFVSAPTTGSTLLAWYRY